MVRTIFKKVPFDLELAKKITNKEFKGHIVTRDGRQARIVCFDRIGRYPIVCLVMTTDGKEIFYSYSENGHENNSYESSLDLRLEVPTYYKDYSDFKPCKWQPCLVRDSISDNWIVRVCKGIDSYGEPFFFSDGSNKDCFLRWVHVLPLSKITERLIGTTKSYGGLIQELDTELTVSNKPE